MREELTRLGVLVPGKAFWDQVPVSQARRRHPAITLLSQPVTPREVLVDRPAADGLCRTGTDGRADRRRALLSELVG